MVTIAERLKKAREDRGLTQEYLSQAVGTTVSTVWRWEKGQRSPSKNALSRIALALNTSVAYLIGETNDPVRYAESLLVSAGKKPEEMTGNPPPPLSPTALLRRRQMQAGKASSESGGETVSPENLIFEKEQPIVLEFAENDETIRLTFPADISEEQMQMTLRTVLPEKFGTQPKNKPEQS